MKQKENVMKRNIQQEKRKDWKKLKIAEIKKRIEWLEDKVKKHMN